ncbi:hypothetical protein HZA75_06570, partial [Candidatus Roizmanbacteria bacterium]|nr:hypothetical protein [Candidatus Roizmanbacteria bacterium]
MKKTIFIAFILLIFCFWGAPAFSQTENNEEEKLLQETLSLSKKVKDFEKTIGIQPSSVFSTTTKEKSSQSLRLWVHNLENILEEPIMTVSIKFETSAEKIPPIKDFWIIGKINQLYSYYFRIVDIYADPDLPITVEFAKKTVSKKAMLIIHEDMHLADILLGGEEFVTPLAEIAALKFFENIGDEE